jgi:hypothetical protein
MNIKLDKLFKLFKNELIYKESYKNVDYWLINHHKIHELYLESNTKDLYTICLLDNKEDNKEDKKLSEIITDIKLIYVDDINIDIDNQYDFIDGYFTIKLDENDSKECFIIKLINN